MASQPPADASAVRVAVRVRPLLAGERAAERRLAVDAAHGRVTAMRADVAASQARRFAFDTVLDGGASQADAFEACKVEDMVQAVVQGYNATLMTYGMTGSGKTHTLEGYIYDGAAKVDVGATPKERLGLAPRAVELLFAEVAQAATASPADNLAVSVSYVQIYKEQAYDLLTLGAAAGAAGGEGGASDGSRRRPAGAGLRMRWTRQAGFYLEGLSEHPVADADEVMALFHRGVAAKVMATHALNRASSRSHALLTVTVERTHTVAGADGYDSRVVSRLSLVDLAGSERAALTGATGRQLQEAQAINKSLFNLRKVISALAEPAGKRGHVPYRDSKLTSLLKHSLGGNSLTTMVVCISPADDFVDESISSLEYAAKATAIVNAPALNVDPRERLIQSLRERVRFLEAQLAQTDALGAAGLPLDIGGGVGSAMVGGVTGGQPTAASAGTALSSTLSQPFTDSATGATISLEERLVQTVGLVKSLQAANSELRRHVGRSSGLAEAESAQADELRGENAELRDRLSMLEAVIAMEDPDGEGAAAAAGEKRDAAVMASALTELAALREENAGLKRKLERRPVSTSNASGSGARRAASATGGARRAGATSSNGGASRGGKDALMSVDQLRSVLGAGARRAGTAGSRSSSRRGASSSKTPAKAPARAPAVQLLSTTGRLKSTADLANSEQVAAVALASAEPAPSTSTEGLPEELQALIAARGKLRRASSQQQ